MGKKPEVTEEKPKGLPKVFEEIEELGFEIGAVKELLKQTSSFFQENFEKQNIVVEEMKKQIALLESSVQKSHQLKVQEPEYQKASCGILSKIAGICATAIVAAIASFSVFHILQNPDKKMNINSAETIEIKDSEVYIWGSKTLKVNGKQQIL